MAKFKFRLATFLRLREATRDERRAELAEAYRVDDLLRQRQDTVGRELGWLKSQCRRAAGPGAVNIDQLVEGQRYELALKAQQSQLARQREAVAAEIQRRQQALVEANREVRVLEKLRERQALHHQQEENRQEIKQLDETAGRRAAQEAVL
jgi:flagellar FliJ protein